MAFSPAAWVLFLSLLLLFSCAGKPVRTPTILIGVDTLRRDYVGAYNPKRADLTPNMDALLRDSVVCRRAYTVVPQTFPSFSSVFTGVYPWRHGAVNNQGFAIRRDVPVLTERFQEQGYYTAAVIGAVPLRFGKGLERGFTVYDDAMFRRPATGNPLFDAANEDAAKFQSSQRQAMDVTRVAMDLMDRAPLDQKPLFLFVHYYDPHAPYSPPGEYAKKYAAEPYAGEVAYTDEAIGALLRHLKEKGIYDRALIVLFADHGEGLGEHGEPYHGYFLYEPTVAVPLAFKLPRALAGRFRTSSVESAVSLMDITPTVCELQGITPPAGLDGRTLAPDMRGTAPPNDEAILLSTEMPYFYFGWEKLYAVLRFPLKAVISSEPQVFNVAADPGETANLYPRDYDALYRIFKGRYVASGPAEAPAGAEDAQALKSLGYLSSAPQQKRKDSIPPSRWPDKLRVLTEAETAQFKGDLAAALAVYDAFLKQYPEDFQSLVSRAEILLRMGRSREAEDDFLKARAISDNYEIQRELLALYRGAGDKRKYHDLLAEARAKSPDVLFLDAIADDYLLQDDTAGALAFLKGAMAAYPRESYPHLRAYGLLMEARRTDEAAALARSITEGGTADAAVVRFFTGMRLEMEGKPDGALEAFRECARLGAGFYQPYFEAGLLLKDKRDFGEAARNLNAARLLAPGNPRILFEWADCLAASGHLPEARQGFTLASRIQPDNPNIRLALMKAAWALGDRAAALQQRDWLRAHAPAVLESARRQDTMVAQIP